MSARVENPACRATNPIIIAVMGSTGSGKTSFIKLMTGDPAILIGETLASDTKEIAQYRFEHNDTAFVLIDTPGFDDSRYSNDVIVERILNWLEAFFQKGKRLNGLIYLHRITDPRMHGSALKNMHIFRELCGEDCMPNVVFATTFWDQVSAEIGEARQAKLATNPEFWAPMRQRGASVTKLGHDRESGLAVLEALAKKPTNMTKAEIEMAEGGKTASETSAARQARERMQQVKAEMEADISREERHARDEIAYENWKRQKALDAKEKQGKRMIAERQGAMLQNLQGFGWSMVQMWLDHR